jgi:hypothetical protein
VIVDVRGTPGMLGVAGDRLVPLDTIWEVTARATVVDGDGTVLAGPEIVSVDGRSVSGGNVTAERAIGAGAREALMEQLARAIVRGCCEGAPGVDGAALSR